MSVENRVLLHLTELARRETGYRVGPRSVAHELGESEEAVKEALDSLVAKRFVGVFQNFGQDYWGVK